MKVHAPKVGAFKRVLGAPSKIKKLLITNKVTGNCSCIICIPYVYVGNYEFFDRHYAPI